LLQSLKDAECGNYALGIKLVRGAYHEQEAASDSGISISPEVDPPVYLTKAQTDTSFDECARILVDRISLDVRHNSHPRISVLFGTHNMESCRLIISLLEQEGLANADPLHGTVCIPRSTALRVAFGQLFGMPSLSQ
jgi:proline dehydrogenase